MRLKSIADLYLSLLRDIYYAEKQVAKNLTKLVKVIADAELKNLIDAHVLETKVQEERLERIFESLGVAPKGEKCAAMDGLIQEAQDMIEKSDTPAMLDATIVAACRKIEHYEIASYGAMIEMAKLLGHVDQAKLLRDTLKEEKAAVLSLSALAESHINKQALAD